MTATHQFDIPAALTGRTPRWYIELVRHRGWVRLLLFVVAFCGSWGLRNGWIDLLVPIAAPLGCVLNYIVWPFNPYRGRFAENEGMDRLDLDDSSARALAELFKTSAGRKEVLREAARISLQLYVLNGVVMLLQHPVNWWFDVRWVAIISFIVGGSCLALFETHLFSWACQKISAPE